MRTPDLSSASHPSKQPRRPKAFSGPPIYISFANRVFFR
ncbi:hypothetical protein NY78_3445 [Desulfovibrio sp. TomC]|nr:hypothetical protein NY78_3445 [Desulfovibrio sp. TomC]